MKHFNPHVGLRTIKTGIAVALALALAIPFLGGRSPIFIAFGAILGISRTFRDSLQAMLDQYIGVFAGGIISMMLVSIAAPTPPLLIGLGIIAAIYICTFFRVEVSAVTACFLVLYAAGDDTNVLTPILFRLLDTSAGLTIGLMVNAVIKPYNNRPRLVAQLELMTKEILPYIQTLMVDGLYPDLDAWSQNLRILDDITEEYSRQKFGGKRDLTLDIMYFRGLRQLMHRIYHELNVLSSMDNFGAPSAANLAHMKKLGIDTSNPRHSKCQETTMVVANFHLEKLLHAYDYLLELLEDDKKQS